VGIHQNIVSAAIKAIFNGLNRAAMAGQRVDLNQAIETAQEPLKA